MTDLTRLKVSLTKEGAHKAFFLLRDIDISAVIQSTRGVVDGINIDAGQIRNILSAGPEDQLPEIWQTAKAHSDDTLKYLVFLAIVFSHHKLIEAFKAGALGRGQGIIRRKDVPHNKVFTNIRGETVNLGLADYRSDVLEYDTRPLLRNSVLGGLASQLFHLKLLKAKWNETNSIAQEAIKNGFHEVLSIDEATFQSWLVGDAAAVDVPDPDKEIVREFVFSSGHNPAKEGRAKRSLPSEPPEVKLIHNTLQTKLYAYLSGQVGEDNVGTEVATGIGTNSIDVVTVEGNQITFYELKTRHSVRLCIREALPQLLEYCYWPAEDRCNRLIIVAEAKVTKDAASYLKKLRTDFSIPIYYAQINGENGKLSKLS